MDSINKNQKEENHKDLARKEAIEKIREIVDQANTCFFCTSLTTGSTHSSRPMSVQKIDDEGNLWFLSAKDSHKNKELARDPDVQLFFQGSKHSDFLQLHGKATIMDNKSKIKELWEPVLKTWFTEGVDDPRISVIRVELFTGYYWDNKHGNAVAGVKMLIGAMLGKTMDDSIEGKLRMKA